MSNTVHRSNKTRFSFFMEPSISAPPLKRNHSSPAWPFAYNNQVSHSHPNYAFSPYGDGYDKQALANRFPSMDQSHSTDSTYSIPEHSFDGQDKSGFHSPASTLSNMGTITPAMLEALDVPGLSGMKLNDNSQSASQELESDDEQQQPQTETSPLTYNCLADNCQYETTNLDLYKFHTSASHGSFTLSSPPLFQVHQSSISQLTNEHTPLNEEYRQQKPNSAAQYTAFDLLPPERQVLNSPTSIAHTSPVQFYYNPLGNSSSAPQPSHLYRNGIQPQQIHSPRHHYTNSQPFFPTHASPTSAEPSLMRRSATVGGSTILHHQTMRTPEQVSHNSGGYHQRGYSYHPYTLPNTPGSSMGSEAHPRSPFSTPITEQINSAQRALQSLEDVQPSGARSNSTSSGSSSNASIGTQPGAHKATSRRASSRQTSRSSSCTSTPRGSPVASSSPTRRTKTMAPPPLIVSYFDKAHVCAVCDKRFKRLEHLKRHNKTHTGEKMFRCNVDGCGKYFSRSDNLMAHLRTHGKRGGRNIYVPNLVLDSPTSHTSERKGGRPWPLMQNEAPTTPQQENILQRSYSAPSSLSNDELMFYEVKNDPDTAH